MIVIAMRYNKIFWLEDMPDFLEQYLRDSVCADLKRDDLLARITWAHDFEEGARIIYSSNFDLYLLDADFPDACEPKHRKNAEACLELIQSNKWGEGKIKRYQDDSVTNNFVKFYQQFLAQSKNKVVVHSMSTLAPIFAFALGLPFYCKGGLNEGECKNDEALWRKHIKLEAELEDAGLDAIFESIKIDRKKLDLESLKNYECGAAVHFIKKYLT